jgi:hypothetical protein
MATISEARKRYEERQPPAMLAEAERLNLNSRVLAALQRVYGDATALEGDALRDALEDEGFTLTAGEVGLP